jgi:hypothetical protein
MVADHRDPSSAEHEKSHGARKFETKAKSGLRTGASFTEPDALVIHPTNLSTIQTAKDTTGRYITNDPAASGPEQSFGMRGVATTKITRNTPLMGNLAEVPRFRCARPRSWKSPH